MSRQAIAGQALSPAGPVRRRRAEQARPLALALLCLVGLAASLRSEVIDRIAVSVGNRVITASDLDREIRVTAFLNGKRPDFSPAAKRETAERMVEQELIRRDLDNSRYPSATLEDVQPALDKFKAVFYRSTADYERALAAAGIASQDLIDVLIWQRNLLEFTDARFRPGVQLTEQEIQEYFDKNIKPRAEAAQPGGTVELENYRASIEETLVGARVDREIDDWLKRARERAQIVFHDEAFQ